MESIYYNSLQFSLVEDINDFFRANLPEMPKVKAICDQTRHLFSLPNDCIELYVSQGDRVYKIVMLLTDSSRAPFGNIVYLPFEKRLDLYTGESGYPIAQWKNKTLTYSGYPLVFQKAGVDKIFSKIVNVAF